MTPEYLGSMLDRLWALYSVEQLGNHYMRQLDRAEFMSIVQPPFEQFGPDFSSKGWNTEHGMPQAKFAVAKFLYAFENSMTCLPMGWQRPFREAFDRGEIDGIALGAAMHLIYRMHSPRRGARGGLHPETLANLRVADPAGIMNGPSFAIWRSLPDRVTIYRAALTYSADEAAHGISWTFSRGYAAAHLYRRMLPIHEATEIRKRMGQSPPPPQLLTTVAPKSSILAMIGSEDHEVFVDYEQLDPAQIKRLPTNNLLMQAVSEKIGAFGRLALAG